MEPTLADLERRMIVDALAATDDNEVAAAKRLAIGERTLWTKLEKHGISPRAAPGFTLPLARPARAQ